MINEEYRQRLTHWCDWLADAVRQVEGQLKPVEVVNIVGDPDLSYPTKPLHELLTTMQAHIATLTDER
jgi:hypothetical protein